MATTSDTGKNKKCLYCGKRLLGRQGRFCSDQHRNKYWSERRKVGIQAIDAPPAAISDSPRMREMWSAILTFWERYEAEILQVMREGRKEIQQRNIRTHIDGTQEQVHAGTTGGDKG